MKLKKNIIIITWNNDYSNILLKLLSPFNVNISIYNSNFISKITTEVFMSYDIAIITLPLDEINALELIYDLGNNIDIKILAIADINSCGYLSANIILHKALELGASDTCFNTITSCDLLHKFKRLLYKS